jgi:translocation protein SEC66
MDEEPPITKISVYTPIIYVTIMVGALIVFSIKYRQKKINELATRKPFFERNVAKEMYFELVAQDPKPNEKVLKAALIRRGAECVKRTLKLKEVTPFMTVLYQKGSISDDLWERFQTSQKLEELEIQELVAETEKYKSGWIGKFIPLLQEVCLNEALGKKYGGLEDKKLGLLKEWGIEIDKEGKLKFPNTIEAKEE